MISPTNMPVLWGCEGISWDIFRFVSNDNVMRIQPAGIKRDGDDHERSARHERNGDLHRNVGDIILVVRIISRTVIYIYIYTDIYGNNTVSWE